MSDKWRDYYWILGVRPDATQQEIKEAWLFGVKAFHPDKFAGSSPRQQAVAQERTKAVNEAYYILSDAIRRADYDHEYARKTGAESTSPPHPRSEPPPEPPKTASSADTAGLYVAWLVGTAMLLSAAVEKHLYGFYMLLRWGCCAVFAWSAFIAHKKNRQVWVWTFGALALLYNPIVLVHLNRRTWINVNWFTVGVISIAAIAFLTRRAQIWIDTAAALVVVIASLAWGVARVQTPFSSTRPQVPASFIAIGPTPVPRAIPRAIPVASTAEQLSPTPDSQSGNVIDQFDMASTASASAPATTATEAPPSDSTRDLTAQKPKFVYAPRPAYPLSLDKMRVTGSGRFKITFDERGNAKSVKIVQSTGNHTLDSNTINTLKLWRAAPGSPCDIVVPIDYRQNRQSPTRPQSNTSQPHQPRGPQSIPPPQSFVPPSLNPNIPR